MLMNREVTASWYADKSHWHGHTPFPRRYSPHYFLRIQRHSTLVSSVHHDHAALLASLAKLTTH